ncbi:MAG: endonuclease III [Planctomycetota bacterium]
MPAHPNPAQVKGILETLERTYPEETCALHHRSALELLVATILSAQCTDERVNLVTKALFVAFPSAQDYAQAPIGELETAVRSTGFFRNKAKAIQEACKRIVEAYGGRVPDSMEELLTLRGVARKTANVLLGTWFKKNEGVVVDTHVHRIATRLGLTRQKTPEKIEQDLMAVLPRETWTDFSHRIIWHGRRICDARKPECERCPLDRLCPKEGVKAPSKGPAKAPRRPPARRR